MTVQNCGRLAFEVGLMSVFVLIICFHRCFNLLLFISVRDSINLVSSRKDRHCFAPTKLSNVLHCLLAHLWVSIEFIEFVMSCGSHINLLSWLVISQRFVCIACTHTIQLHNARRQCNMMTSRRWAMRRASWWKRLSVWNHNDTVLRVTHVQIFAYDTVISTALSFEYIYTVPMSTGWLVYKIYLSCMWNFTMNRF